jgi:hypothetical protein
MHQTSSASDGAERQYLSVMNRRVVPLIRFACMPRLTSFQTASNNDQQVGTQPHTAVHTYPRCSKRHRQKRTNACSAYKTPVLVSVAWGGGSMKPKVTHVSGSP